MESRVAETRGAQEHDPAKSPISFDDQRKRWVLCDDDLLYVIDLDPDGRVHNRYVGAVPQSAASGTGDPTQAFLEELPSGSYDGWWEWWHVTPDAEYPARSPRLPGEPAVAVLFGAADRDLHLRYAGHEIDGSGLVIRLSDTDHPLGVDLHYELAAGTGVVRRWATIRNDGATAVTLEQAATFAIAQPPGRYTLHHLTGSGLDELRPVSEGLAPGRKVLESRNGITGHEHQPWFALIEADAGATLFGALEWSGNWKLSFESWIDGPVSIVGGMSEYDFEHVLEPGATFTTPAAAIGVAVGGLDEAARAMHRFIRETVQPRRASEKTLPVIYEGWYTAYGSGMTAATLIEEAEAAAEIGVELFIVTAGWYTCVEGTFGFISREGDWRPWPAAFPNGLEEVAEAVRASGMRFGLWWEPESVSTDSELYRAHPEWVFQFEPRGPQPTREGQLVLNLARPDVYEHVRNDIFRLIERYQLDYFRTDMNQSLREAGDPSGQSGPGRDLIWRHVNNYYRILDEVRASFPDLIIENCAGGGGRLDLGMMRRTDTAWISDNVNPLVRLSMFMSGTSFLPPGMCETWAVIDPEGEQRAPSRETSELPTPFGWAEWPQPDLDFILRVCMMGHFGIGTNVARAGSTWQARARHHIARYKELRETIQRGDLYRLTPTPSRNGAGDWAAVAMVAADKSEAVAFCYRLASDAPAYRLLIPDLDQRSAYEVEFDGTSERVRVDGADLSTVGINVPIADRYSSALVIVRHVSPEAS